MNRRTLIISISICVVIVALAAAFASSHPDGLEWVATRLGFAGREVGNSFQSPLPDYSLLPIRSTFWSTFIAGTIGAALVFVFVLGVGKLMCRGR